jgi:hypothetical protein
MLQVKNKRAGRALQAGILLGILLVGGGGWLYYRQEVERNRIEEAAIAALKAEQRAEAERREIERLEAQRIQQAKASLASIEERWRDAFGIARVASRIALPGPVASLQAIRREAQALDVPPCLLVARAHLVDGMTEAIRGFTTFMGDLQIGGISAHFALQAANKKFDASRQALGNCERR